MLEHCNGGPRWNKVPATDQTSFTIPCAPSLRLTAIPLLSNAPLLVMIAHGGPTSMVCLVLNPQNQFLCHQGFAAAEVNYRGSSEKTSRRSLFMQGRSSGGYTAPMALVSSGYFTAGVSQFGVSGPERLRQMTHRFESGYLDWLLGPWIRYRTSGSNAHLWLRPVESGGQWRSFRAARIPSSCRNRRGAWRKRSERMASNLWSGFTRKKATDSAKLSITRIC